MLRECKEAQIMVSFTEGRRLRAWVWAILKVEPATGTWVPELYVEGGPRKLSQGWWSGIRISKGCASRLGITVDHWTQPHSGPSLWDMLPGCSSEGREVRMFSHQPPSFPLVESLPRPPTPGMNSPYLLPFLHLLRTVDSHSFGGSAGAGKWGGRGDGRGMRACTRDAGPSEVGRGTRKAAVTRKIGFPRVGWN